MNESKTTTPAECDLYSDRDALIEADPARNGNASSTPSARTVRRSSTDDHYATFTRVTRWSIQEKQRALDPPRTRRRDHGRLLRSAMSVVA
ncbi:MAG: hypothetical protein MZU97_12990 [Bacillus subtilis]|nr:hypothetical protein [Bacillus subtilis]